MQMSARLCMLNIMSLGICLKKIVARQSIASNFAFNIYIFDVQFERRKVDKKQTYMKTETCKLYSRVFRIFVPNVIKIYPCNFELYRLEVGAFFLRRSVEQSYDAMRE